MTHLATAAAENVRPIEQAVTEADFADLMRENQRMVYSIAFNFLRDQAKAEDLAQDVFLQLYQNLGRMESRSHVTHWLRRVTGHRAIDVSRKGGFGKEVDLEAAPEPATEDSPADPLLRGYLQRLVASLPEKKRLLVILRYQEEMELGEIAKVVRMPERTVRTQLWRTIAQLRRKASRLLGEADLMNGEVSR